MSREVITLKVNGNTVVLDNDFEQFSQFDDGLDYLIEQLDQWQEENKIIKMQCYGTTETKPFDLLRDFQGDYKTISLQSIFKLTVEILTKGFTAPIFLWNYTDDESSEDFIIDGHQRVKVLNLLNRSGFSLPKIPVTYIEAKTRKEAFSKLFGIDSVYGEKNDKTIKITMQKEGFSPEETQTLQLVTQTTFEEQDTHDRFEDTMESDVEKTMEVEKETLVPYKKHHILISIPTKNVRISQKILSFLSEFEGDIEVEQSAN